MNKLRRTLLCLLCAITVPAAANGETWRPTKPIVLVVGAGAGTTPDIIARIIKDSMSEALGQPIVIENQPGQAGGMAARRVARSAPDGHTITLSTSSIAGLPAVIKDLGFDPVADFEHIAMIASTPRVFAVHRDVPADNFQDLIKLIRNNPGVYHYGGVVNALEQFQAESLKKMHALDMAFIPYKTGSQMFADFLGGHVKMVTYPLPQLIEHVRDGQIKIIAHSWHTRLPELPTVPTWRELGYPDMQISAWYGIVAPRGTPEPVQRAIRDAVNHALRDKATQDRLLQQRYYPLNGTAADPKHTARSTTATVVRMGREVGIAPQ